MSHEENNNTPQFEINKTKSEVELVDVMEGCIRWDIKIHDHGLVSLVDCMPRLIPKGETADFAIVQAARVSYGLGTKKKSEDAGLTRYLIRHRHTTPVEMVEMKFHCVMPIFVARQWIRHRTANVNEYSARYSMMPDKFYRPERDDIKTQSNSNRQGASDQKCDDLTADEFLKYLDRVESEYDTYKNLLDQGLTREQARIGLPVNVYTEWYWKCDLHNIFRFLSLRMDEHAQKEIRDYATAMFHIVEKICPIASKAFLEYQVKSINLTEPEIQAINNKTSLLVGRSAGETNEYREKLVRMGLKFGDEDQKAGAVKQAPPTPVYEDNPPPQQISKLNT